MNTSSAEFEFDPRELLDLTNFYPKFTTSEQKLNTSAKSFDPYTFI